MFLVPTDTPGVEIVRNIGLMGEQFGDGHDGMHALIHYNEVRVPAESLLGGRGPGLRHRPDPSGRRAHPPRHAHGGHVPEGARHDVRAGAVAARPRAACWPTSRACRTTSPTPTPSSCSSGCFVLYVAWEIDQYQDYRKVRHDIAAVKVLTPQVLHDIVQRSIQVHGALGCLQRDAPGRAVDDGARSWGWSTGPARSTA